MISVEMAETLLNGLLPAPTGEFVPLESSNGRTLFRPVLAERDGPPYHRVAMDGYAVDSAEALRSWTVDGAQFAGRAPVTRLYPGTAVEVATGAVLPKGCDAVIPYENTARHDEVVVLKADFPLPVSGRHVLGQGEDYRRGQTLITAGTLLKSPHLHILATEGLAQLPVHRRASWALAATGDELVEVEATPLPWQIRRSNAAAIAGEAGSWGLKPSNQLVLADNAELMEHYLRLVMPGLDVLVLTGGVSAGKLDLVPEVLGRLGIRPLFHKVAQRPGKPLWCGKGEDGPLVFGLPGNPVSSLFSFRRYVLPWLLAFEGRPVAVRRVAVSGLTRATDQTVFVPWSERHGVLDWKGSGDFAALSESDGFLQLDPEPDDSHTALFFPWGGGF